MLKLGPIRNVVIWCVPADPVALVPVLVGRTACRLGVADLGSYGTSRRPSHWSVVVCCSYGAVVARLLILDESWTPIVRVRPVVLRRSLLVDATDEVVGRRRDAAVTPPNYK